MTAQRIATHVVGDNSSIHKAVEELLLDHYRSSKSTVQRLVWVCEICGMVHLAQTPNSCDCCGATDALAQQTDTRQEIGNNW